MEDVNVSSNPSPHEAHFGIESHPMFGNNKKVLMEQSDATVDSGYMTNWSISHNHTATSSFTSSRIGSPRSALASGTASFKQCTELETIAEHFDTKSSAVETPTTRNIRQLSEFHINTPQNNRSQFETTPKKPNYFLNASGGSLSARKKNRFWSPYESPNAKRNSAGKIKSPARRSALFDRNDENSYDENVCDQSIYFSPIKLHNNSNVIQASNSPRVHHNIQRHASGIGTSTPKFTFRRTLTHSALQPNNNDQDHRLVRKIKSFNPIHRASSVLKDSTAPNRQDSIDFINEIDDSPAKYNPAKKMLAFSSQQFEQLIQPSQVTASLPKTPVKVNNVADSMSNRVAEASTLSPRKLANYRSQSRLIREFTKKKPTRSWPKKTVKNSNESDIRMLSVSHDSATATLAHDMMDECCLSFTDEIKPLPSASTLNLNLKETKIDTPTRNDSISHSIREEANRTPTKRFERCTSHHSISMKSSPEKEKNKILYHDLPCTPPKTYIRRPLKRQASALADITQPKVEPPAKRKLYRIERDTYYDGMEHLDIFKHLITNFKMAPVTEQILSYLSGKDLHAAYCVSKDWSTVIDSCKKSRMKRRQYVKQSESIKENIFETTANTTNLSTNNNNDTFKRKPFQLYNDKEEVSFDVPLSPSSRRFRERQEVSCMRFHILPTEKKQQQNQHTFLMLNCFCFFCLCFTDDQKFETKSAFNEMP